MAKPRNIHVVFQRRSKSGLNFHTGTKNKVTFGVFLDLDALDDLAMKVSKNKSRRGHDGPAWIEIHSIEAFDA